MTPTDYDDECDHLAAAYALGTLDAEARREVETAMATDPDLTARIEAWEARLAPLALALPEVQPPPGLLARLETRIRREERRRGAEETVFAEEGIWQIVAAGVRIKVLSVDAAAGVRSFLLSMDAGARLPAHRHASVEECMMIAGDLVLGDLALKAGDYHRIAAGTHHPTGLSRTGCIAFIRGDTEVEAA